jgi:hypothetical protein
VDPAFAAALPVDICSSGDIFSSQKESPRVRLDFYARRGYSSRLQHHDS